MCCLIPLIVSFAIPSSKSSLAYYSSLSRIYFEVNLFGEVVCNIVKAPINVPLRAREGNAQNHSFMDAIRHLALRFKGYQGRVSKPGKPIH